MTIDLSAQNMTGRKECEWEVESRVPVCHWVRVDMQTRCISVWARVGTGMHTEGVERQCARRLCLARAALHTCTLVKLCASSKGWSMLRSGEGLHSALCSSQVVMIR